MLLSGKSVFPEGNPMTAYNYCGSKRWSGKERQQFRRAWRVHRKQFQLLRSAVGCIAITRYTPLVFGMYSTKASSNEGGGGGQGFIQWGRGRGARLHLVGEGERGAR